MLNYEHSKAFKRDYKRMIRQSKDIRLLESAMYKLISEEKLTARYRDHALTGNYAGYRECHLQPNWLLVYKIEGGTIIFTRTGSHSELDLS